MELLPRVALYLLMTVPACCAAGALLAQEPHNPPAPPANSADTHKDADKDKDKDASAIPAEKSVPTHHELAIGGKTLKYTATAGTLLIRDEEDKPYGSIFYVAYTLDGAEPGSRPVSFLYNGGPGSATLWLHMGSFSPVRIQTDSPNPTAGPPFKLVPNEYSLLDKTDLVFIDAPLTGYSRAVGKATAKDFAGVDQDLRAFDRFIERYLNVNQRWNSPKFLIGESYGTTRSAALVDMLANNGVQMNGVVLISSILNYNIRAGGYDMLFIANLPSYAAAAWYFDKIPNKPADLGAWVQEARTFASGAYAQALFAGHNLPADQLDTVAKEVSRFTGLSVDYVKEANLRISPTRFRKEVLRQDRRTLGRYDMRFEGVDLDSAGESPSYDASDAGISGAFVAALHDYLGRELKFESTDTYRPTAYENLQWDWKHRPTSGNGRRRTVSTVCGSGFGQRSEEESSLEGILGKWLFRPGHAVFLHRIRSLAHGPGAGAARECAVWLLPFRPHDLPECGCAAQAEGRSGGVYRESGRKLSGSVGEKRKKEILRFTTPG